MLSYSSVRDLIRLTIAFESRPPYGTGSTTDRPGPRCPLGKLDFEESVAQRSHISRHTCYAKPMTDASLARLTQNPDL